MADDTFDIDFGSRAAGDHSYMRIRLDNSAAEPGVEVLVGEFFGATVGYRLNPIEARMLARYLGHFDRISSDLSLHQVVEFPKEWVNAPVTITYSMPPIDPMQIMAAAITQKD